MRNPMKMLLNTALIGYKRTVYTAMESHKTVELCAHVFSPAGGSRRDIVISATTHDEV